MSRINYNEDTGKMGFRERKCSICYFKNTKIYTAKTEVCRKAILSNQIAAFSNSVFS